MMAPVLALLALALAVGGGDPSARFAAANRLQAEGDLEGAARAYEALLAEGLESPALHVNLGAARLRAGRRGAAIASFERALRIDPADPDALADLAVARGGGGGEVAAAPERPFHARVVARTPDGWAAAAFAVPWVAFFLALALRRRAGGRAGAVLGAAAALAGLLSVGGGALLAARVAWRRAEVAIVISPEAAVREGPEEALRPALRLREGAEVGVLETRGGVVRVRLADGAEGWMRAGDVERI